MPEFGIQGSKFLQWWYTSLQGNKYLGQYLKWWWTHAEFTAKLGPVDYMSSWNPDSSWLVWTGWTSVHSLEKPVVWKGISHSFSVLGLLMGRGTVIAITHFQTAAFFPIAEAIWSAWCFSDVRKRNPLIHFVPHLLTAYIIQRDKI